MICPHQ